MSITLTTDDAARMPKFMILETTHQTPGKWRETRAQDIEGAKRAAEKRQTWPDSTLHVGVVGWNNLVSPLAIRRAEPHTLKPGEWVHL